MKKKELEEILSKRNNGGITLIALVITIIVLLILAGVTIATLTGENGILTQAQKAKTTTEVAEIKERVKTDVLGWQAGSNGEEINNEELKTILDKYFNEVPGVYNKDTEITAKNEYGGHTMKVSDVYDGEMKGYVGYYADLNNDGKITLEDDGIIYADLAVGRSGMWNTNVVRTNYSYNRITTGLKQYYIGSKTTDVDPLKTGKGIIREVERTSGTERFYVMALKDFEKDGKNKFYWYYNANGKSNNIKEGKLDDIVEIDANDFGQGKAKTATEIGRWNSKYYGEQTTAESGKNYIDMWGAIQGKVSEGWFVPSKAEWSAFGDFLDKDLGITEGNYKNLGLSEWYWSSSQFNSIAVYAANFTFGSVMGYGGSFCPDACVRLGKTF